MITTILEFFALGTIGFWILCSLISVIFIIALENENRWFPSILSVAFGLIYWKALSTLALDWHAIAIGVLVYAVVGVLWSIFRWVRFIKNISDKYRRDYGGTLSDNKFQDLKREVNPTKHKGRITGWIAYWPWSMLWNVTGDFFKMIYEGLQGVYSNLSDKALGKFVVQPDKTNSDHSR